VKKYFLLIFLILFSTKSVGSVKNEIIKSFSEIKNLNFEFTQTINGKDETGNCSIVFPKKIYCKYNFKFNKVLVSNGNSLVIKSDKNNQYYRYSLKDTALNLLLDKKYILGKMRILKGSLIDEKFFLFSIEENNQTLNIFFDKNNYNLIGWQTEDIYQNLTITYIYDLKVNQNIEDEIFRLPKNN